MKKILFISLITATISSMAQTPMQSNMDRAEVSLKHFTLQKAEKTGLTSIEGGNGNGSDSGNGDNNSNGNGNLSPGGCVYFSRIGENTYCYLVAEGTFTCEYTCITF